MRLITCAFICAAITGPATAKLPHATAQSEVASIALVRAFFVAFDARNEPAMLRLMAPTASLTHDNGVTTDVPTMMKIIRETREWPPRTRELSHFRVEPLAGGAQVLTLLNKVRFTPAGRAPTESNYNETWVLEKGSNGLKAVRIHYSLVTREQHSEDVP